MEQIPTTAMLRRFLGGLPNAKADIRGSSAYKSVKGTAYFWQTGQGVLVTVEVSGLPLKGRKPCDQPFFALHIHEGGSCTGDRNDPFSGTGGHYNPNNCLHPNHAGDLPPLLSNSGEAWLAVVTDRFRIRDILGRSVVIHDMADDFKTQPSGGSGTKIACGEIRFAWR